MGALSCCDELRSINVPALNESALMIQQSSTTIVAVLCMVLAGCGAAPKPLEVEQAVVVALPTEFSQPTEFSRAQQAPAADWQWLLQLNVPQLPELLAEAIANNPDLAQGAARVRASLAQAGIAEAPLWPQIGASLAHNRGGAPQIDFADAQALFAGPLDNLLQPLRRIPHFDRLLSVENAGDRRLTRSDWNAGLQLAWELDVWGRLQDQRSAARQQARAALDDLRAARSSLLARVTQNWLLIIEAQQQLALFQHLQQSFSRQLDLVEQRYRQAAALPSDVRLARANAAAADDRLLQANATQQQLLRQLEQLLGRYPSTELAVSAQFPVMQALPDAGVPTDLLARRPDIRAAWSRVLAASDAVNSARKAWLPNLRMTGNVGWRSREWSELVRPESLLWNLSQSLAATLFDGGLRKAQRSQAWARFDEAVAVYRALVLNAMLETENALAADKSLAQRQSALNNQVQEAREAQQLSERQYKAGLSDYLLVLQAQRQQLSAEAALLQVERERWLNRIALHLALGGGFVAVDIAAELANHSGTQTRDSVKPRLPRRPR